MFLLKFSFVFLLLASLFWVKHSSLLMKDILEMNKENCLLLYLCAWMCFLSLQSMPKNFYNLGQVLWGLMFFLNLLVFFSFLVTKFVLFYIFFEISLIPIFFIIGVWGSQPERIEASAYLLFYTVFGSLPLLVSLVYLKSYWGSLDYLWMSFFYSKKIEFKYWIFFLFFTLAFFMKMPVFGVHNWLAKAHVEAPVVGSMLLASLLLKLGGFGLMRVGYFFLVNFSYGKIIYLWVSLSMFLVGMMCLRKIDFKSLMAYSSIVHMSVGVLSLLLLSKMSVQGALLVFVAHGLCSSGLFFMVTDFYKSSGCRNLVLKTGVLHMSPLLISLWAGLCFSKSSLPPSLKFFSEIFLLSKIILYKGMTGVMMIKCMVFVKGLFNLFLYLSLAHGQWQSNKKFFKTFYLRSVLMSFFHMVLIFVLFCFMKMML